MRFFAASVVGVFACSGAAMACPSFDLASTAMPLDGAFLASPQRLTVTSGGDNTLEACQLDLLGTGQFRSAPDFSLALTNMTGRNLDLSVSSGCDSALLVNTADGEWLFDDDSNGNLDPALQVPAGRGVDGEVNIWVGTFAGEGCTAELSVQSTLTGGGGGQAPTPVPTPTPAPVTPAPVAACPDPSILGATFEGTGADLAAGVTFTSAATGGIFLGDCSDIGGYGFASQAPQFSLFLSVMQDYLLTAEVSSECDPTLLIRDGLGRWHFDDDGAGGLQPFIELQGGAVNGRVDVWIGSFDMTGCPANVVFQTRAASGLAPVPAPAPLPQPQVAMGCPDPNVQGPAVTTTGDALFTPTDYTLTAGGGTAISDCDGLPGVGFFSITPAYSFYLSGMEVYDRLEIEGSASCDISLLVRTPDGQWHFDDDSNGNLEPRLDLVPAAALNGRLDVWVGTFGGGTCPAIIEMETW